MGASNADCYYSGAFEGREPRERSLPAAYRRMAVWKRVRLCHAGCEVAGHNQSSLAREHLNRNPSDEGKNAGQIIVSSVLKTLERRCRNKNDRRTPAG